MNMWSGCWSCSQQVEKLVIDFLVIQQLNQQYNYLYILYDSKHIIDKQASFIKLIPK